jgi:hypothetical protein
MTAKTRYPSIWLRLVAFYFKAGGVLLVILAVLGLFTGLALRWAPTTTRDMPYTFAIGSLLVMAVALLATGILLGRRLRAGGVLGLGVTLYPLVLALFQGRSVGWPELGFTAVMAIALVSIWRELEWRHGSSAVRATVPPS